MPRKCCVDVCNNSVYKNYKLSTKIVTFHLFPKNDKLRSVWCHRIQMANNEPQQIFSRSAIVCSDHFELSDLRQRGQKVYLTQTAIPSVFPKSEFSRNEMLCPTEEEITIKEVTVEEVMIDTNPLEIKLEAKEESPTHPSTFELITIPSSQPGIHSGISNTMNVNTSVSVVQSDHNSTNFFEMIVTPIVTNTLADEFILSTATPKKRTVRYAGDIDVNEEMDPPTASHLRLCQDKINSQAKEIYRLKQTTKRQRCVIDRLKKLLNELKTLK